MLHEPSSDDASALDHANEDDDDGEHEQDVNQSTHGRRGDHAEQPEYDEDGNDCHQHDVNPERVTRTLVTRHPCGAPDASRDADSVSLMH